MAYVEQQSNVATIVQELGPSLKTILTNYGCDEACLEGVPLDVISIAQASAYCSCPDVIVVDKVNFKSMDVTKILMTMIPKSEAKATMTLMSTPEVVPQTSYLSSGLFLAAMIAGGLVYRNKKNKDTEKDDIFTHLV